MRFRKNHRIQVSFKSVTNTKTTLTKCKDKTHTFEEDSINLRNAVKLWLSNKRLAINIYGHISRWDVSKVKDFSWLFANIIYISSSDGGDFRQYLGDTTDFDEDLSCWNVSNAITMERMFEEAKKFNQPLNNWNVSKVKNMEGMFNFTENFNQPLDKWNVSNVETMKSMFNEAVNFNQPLNNWDVRNVINMRQMFYRASLFNQPLNNWNVGKVNNMDEMFEDAVKFNQDLSGWGVQIPKPNGFTNQNKFKNNTYLHPTWNV